VERKFLRSAGLVGHVEDIAVAKSMQGRKLGVKLINALEEIGRTQGCYKIILDCSKDNIRECCHLQMNSVLIRGSVLREVRVSGLTNQTAGSKYIQLTSSGSSTKSTRWCDT
jgi:GNAT superfamily N-acetyltransferase